MSLFKNRLFAAVCSTVLILTALVIGNAKRVQTLTESPTLPEFVTDGAYVLSDSTEASLVRRNLTLAEETGASFFVITLESTGETALSDYVEELISKRGYSGSDLLLVLAISDEDYWFAYGNHWASLLDNRYADLLDQELEPYFARQNYDRGVLSLADSLETLLRDRVKAGYPRGGAILEETTGTRQTFSFFLVVLVLLAVLLLVSLIVHSAQKSQERAKQKRTYPNYPGSPPPGPGYNQYYGTKRQTTPRYSSQPGGNPANSAGRQYQSPPPGTTAPPNQPPYSRKSGDDFWGGFVGGLLGSLFFGGQRRGYRPLSRPPYTPPYTPPPFTPRPPQNRGNHSSFGGFGGGGRPSGGNRSSFGGGGRSSPGRGFGGGGRSSGGGFSGGGRKK